jgi:hypothetical protein
MEGYDYIDILGQEKVDEIRYQLECLRGSAVELLCIHFGLPYEFTKVQKMIEEGDWIVDCDEYNLLQFIVALSRIVTTLREEIFEDSLNELCEVLARYV